MKRWVYVVVRRVGGGDKGTVRWPPRPLLFHILQQRREAYFVADDTKQVAYGYSLLLHCVTIAQCHGVVLKSLVVDSDAEWCSDGILTAVALAYLVLLLILAVEVELQSVDYLPCLLWQSVLLCEREDA